MDTYVSTVSPLVVGGHIDNVGPHKKYYFITYYEDWPGKRTDPDPHNAVIDQHPLHYQLSYSLSRPNNRIVILFYAEISQALYEEFKENHE